MASPVDAARSTSASGGAAVTTLAINVGSPVAENLLVIFIRFMGAPGAVTFTGYTQLASDTSDASDDQTMVFYRWADGTEGASDSVSWVNSVKPLALRWTVTGAENPATQAPEISTVAVGTTAANTANPGSRAVTGGPKDVLYLAMCGYDGEGGSPTAAPTNYVNLSANNTGTAGAVAVNGAIGGASRQISASSSDDPDVFTHPAAANGWTALTVVVHPPGGAPASLLYPPRPVRLSL